MAYTSKPIKKTDVDSKQFIIDCLCNDQTHGFDLDSIYYYNNKWIIFEYLKCENDHMTPHTSHPKYYPYNWKKFYSLYSLAKQLNGELFLVNYSTRDEDKHLVRIMQVLSFDYEKVQDYCSKNLRGPCDYMTLKTWEITLNEFSAQLRKLNKTAMLPPEIK